MKNYRVQSACLNCKHVTSSTLSGAYDDPIILYCSEGRSTPKRYSETWCKKLPQVCETGICDEYDVEPTVQGRIG